MSIRLVIAGTTLRLFSTRDRAARVGTPCEVYPQGFLAKKDGVFWDDAGSISEELAHQILETYVVIGREDRKPLGEPGDYSLVTRQTFYTREAAAKYAATVHSSRAPIVVFGRFFDLRAP